MKRPEAGRGLEARLAALWYGRSPLAWLLLPFAGLFRLVIGIRREAYRAGWLRVHRLSVPVIVVGNITVGGTGKTPVTAWLVELCRAAGYRPGIVSRGYGGRPTREPRLVSPADDPREVGDEPLLLRRQTGAPVCVHVDRVAAGRQLAAEGVNVVIADDGLQHYRLHRDLEIVVLDGERQLGNGFMLPAGPLREPAGRLRDADLVLVNAGPAGPGQFALQPKIGGLRALDGSAVSTLDALRGQRVRAIAGIGNPARFHSQLAEAGLEVVPVAVPDHGCVDLDALGRESNMPIVMTEKDAVKYAPVTRCPVWVAQLEMTVPLEVGERVLRCLNRIRA
ncbi:MAG: tetraacyldisaccharide 4'-kinase [Gammaproteobacteria bacterium]|nr:tetraacyldisaccharide 4'-kinase [Gammaproteobacteria bacterium]